MLKVLGVAFSHAYSSEQIMSNPVTKVKSLKLDTVKRRAFTMVELKRVLNACDAEWRGIVLAGLYTGQRLKDVACLLWGSIDMEKKGTQFYYEQNRANRDHSYSCSSNGSPSALADAYRWIGSCASLFL